MSNHSKAFLGKDYTKIETISIFVCGAGALGSHITESLAQEGYTHLSVVDFDRVEKSNAWTQLYGIRDNGATKVQTLRGILSRKLGLNIIIHDCRLDEKNVNKLLRGQDLIIDVFDNWESRMLVHDYCMQHSINCVHAGMSEQGFSEVKWNERYTAPDRVEAQKDLCDYPLSTPLVKITSSLLHAVVTHYVITGEKIDRSFTLRDITLHKF